MNMTNSDLIMTAIVISDMKQEMKTLLNSEEWHNGNGVTARAVDKLRADIIHLEKILRENCKCHDDSGSCDYCRLKDSV